MAWAPQPCSQDRARCSTSAARTPRPSRWTAQGIVTSFQMNDRCAAGCGRYLGYIADEMNMGVHELGPLAMQAKKCIKINSTCTVFAGAELRERLALGEAARGHPVRAAPRHHPARHVICWPAAAGCSREFTFTGGVARNEAATNALQEVDLGELWRDDDQHQCRQHLHRCCGCRAVRQTRSGRRHGSGGNQQTQVQASTPERRESDEGDSNQVLHRRHRRRQRLHQDCPDEHGRAG